MEMYIYVEVSVFLRLYYVYAYVILEVAVMALYQELVISFSWSVDIWK